MIYYHISISNSNQRFKTLFYNTQYHNDGLVLLLNLQAILIGFLVS